MNTKPSRAKDFFEQIKAGGVPFLKSLIGAVPPTFENDWLDFKGAEVITDDEMKRLWSKAMSGFANTGGGVIVWGIDARRDPATEIDCAGDESLVSKPAAFESRLRQLHPQSCDLPVVNVDFWHGVVDAATDAGVVVCFVPESNFKPHRAEAAGKQYYIRAGDSFHVPSISLLRTLFYPEYHAHLWPELTATWDDGGHIRVEGFIHNAGVATAKNVIVHVEVSVLRGDLWQCQPSLNWQYVGGPHPEHHTGYALMSPLQPIHPEAASGCFRFFAPWHKLKEGVVPITFTISMYSDNNQPLCSRITFTSEDIENKKSVKGRSELLDIQIRPQ